MLERICLVHYHELGLKGRNRPTFERRLLDNMRAALDGTDPVSISRIAGHLLVVYDTGDRLDKAAGILAELPGIVRVSCGWRCSRDEDEYNHAAELALFDCGDFETFKVDAKRSNTDFEKDSMQLNREVGAHLCSVAPHAKVKLNDPDVTVHFNVIQGKVYVWSRTRPAVGGLPVGSAGKVVSLISGGIDSPVASWRLMRRGAVVCGVHFSGRPETNDASEWVVDDIAHALEGTGGLARVYTVAFGERQRAISAECPPELRIILYRRLMLRVSEAIAHIEGAGALVTGESLGQVASQTLDNLAATDASVDMPVLRPLIGTDKTEIIAEAERLGTFEISSRPAEDCCTLFMPRKPATHARIRDCERAEEAIGMDGWVDEIVDGVTWRDYPCAAYVPPERWPRE